MVNAEEAVAEEVVLPSAAGPRMGSAGDDHVVDELVREPGEAAVAAHHVEVGLERHLARELPRLLLDPSH